MANLSRDFRKLLEVPGDLLISHAIAGVGNPRAAVDHFEVGHLQGIQIVRAEQAGPLGGREPIALGGQGNLAAVGEDSDRRNIRDTSIRRPKKPASLSDSRVAACRLMPQAYCHRILSTSTFRGLIAICRLDQTQAISSSRRNRRLSDATAMKPTMPRALAPGDGTATSVAA